MNLRTVTVEHGYVAVQCPGAIVGGVQCWQTVGSIGKGRRGYTAYTEGGIVIGQFRSFVDAFEAIAETA